MQIAFKFVQMKFLAMHINNTKLSFYIQCPPKYWNSKDKIALSAVESRHLQI